jgi:hypothetical protein
MTKKLPVLILAVLWAAGFSYAQTLEVSGEMKTGLFWERTDVPGEETYERARIHNNDDAGNDAGRFRMNMHLIRDDLGTNTIGMKVRFEQTVWTAAQPNQWAFAYAYGLFAEEQLKVVIGKLGESPWSAGGPDIWQELDNQLGIRTEIMPHVVPGLNVGFVLNRWNNSNYYPEKNTLVDILKETVLGAAYTHDYFHLRFAWRLDGESDIYNATSAEKGQEGMDMMYRLEERILRNYLENFSIWVNGWWKGIGTEDQDIVNYENWFYADWAPSAFSAQLRLGYHTGVQRQELHTRLSFYYNILPWLSAGTAFVFRVDFGDSKIKDVPYKLWNIEPQVRATFGPGTYIALVYSFENEPLFPGIDKRTQRLNLRTVYTF